MNRCEQKIKIIDKINKINNWDLLDDIEKQLEKQPQYISDYVVELFEKEFGNLGVDGEIGNIYCTNEVMYAFETDVRRVFLEIGRKNLVSECENINHWTELSVRRRVNKSTNRTYLEDLDFYIKSNMNCAFESYLIAETIFQIWCNKVTFEEP